ncbi:MAG: tRNA 2-thiouridine(34) synthase MnmA [Paludibacteraceae bacterium]|nr:tRNA 2-thiouridine(34) synthase MnmA [Paludibacteraceae bacterium]
MAMSGGIDSSVAAMLLLEQGYELVGVTFRTFDSIKESCLAREKGCCSVESIMEAKHLAEQLGFEHHILDYRQIFRDTVIKNFVEEYMHGRTPNPCVLCNSHIKWGELVRAADELGCDMIATGHYAQIAEHRGHLYLKNAVDTSKDQTYFLWMLTEENLKRTIFPLGSLTKPEVRELAAKHGFERLSKKTESQEICFVPDNDYRTFLYKQGCRVEQGNYVDRNGNVLGIHQGFCNYTIGQRKGLGIALGEPRFVTNINAERNEVTLGDRDDLLSTEITAQNVKIRDIEWLSKDPEVEVRNRYRSQPVKAVIKDLRNGTLKLETLTPVWGVTPGQSLVIYKDNLLVGGGIIDNA